MAGFFEIFVKERGGEEESSKQEAYEHPGSVDGHGS
jgi:hypothetical protein